MLPAVAEAIQASLRVSEEEARSTGFCRRRSKLDASTFCEALVISLMQNPGATLENLAGAVAAQGVLITPQALDQRFTEATATMLRQRLADTAAQLISHDPVALPVLERFSEVRLVDSTTIVLPSGLSSVWQGCGGGPNGEGKAALKLGVGLDLHSGHLHMELRHARKPDNLAGPIELDLPPGSLRVADLGYYSLADFKTLGEQGAYYLSRLLTRTIMLDQKGKKWDVLAFLDAQGSSLIDVPVQLGAEAKTRVACRLLAQRLPQEVADRRRQKLRDDAKKQGGSPPAEAMRRAGWTLLITNVPPDTLSLSEALVVLSVRWQIELLFKLWKSLGRVDKWRSAKPWRVMCEVYAKLIGLILQHWMLLVTCWDHPDRSLFKAAKTLRSYIPLLAHALPNLSKIRNVLRLMKNILVVGCRLNKRSKHPSTYQRFLALETAASLRRP